MMNPFQAANAGGQDGVIFRLTPSFNALQFSSYYGGNQNDACYSVKVDTLNNILTCGGTSSANLTGMVGGLMGSYQGGKSDGFVIRLNPAGTAITAGTYLGRTDYDQAFFVEVDRNNKVFVLGQSVGGIFPTWNAPYANPNSSQFVIKLSNNLSTNLASTTIGNGSSQINISPSAFLIDICGNIYISGWGANILQNVPISGMPISGNAYQSTTTGYDFYLMVMEHDFLSLLYATYMGGPLSHEHVDGGTSRFDKNGVVYQSVCGGCGGHSDFPTTPGAYSGVNNSANCNNLLFKFDFELIPSAVFIANQTIGCEDFQVTFNNFSTQNDDYLWDFGNNNTSTTVFNPTITYTNPGQYQVYLYVTDSICNLTDTAEITITVLDSINFTLFDTLALCSNTPYALTINTNGAANQYLWGNNSAFTPPLTPSPNDSTLLISNNNPGWYYVSAANGYCSKTDSVFVQFDVPVIANYQPSPESGCSPVTVDFNNSSTVTSNFYWDFGNGTFDSTTFEPQVTYTQPGQYLTELVIFDTVCNASDTTSVLINVFPSVSFTLPNSLYLCVDTSITLAPSNVTGNPLSFVWSSTNQFNDTLNVSIQDSSLDVLVPTTQLYFLTATNGNCDYTDSIQVSVFSESISISGPDSVCLNTPTPYTAINNSPEVFSYVWSPTNIIQGTTTQATVNVTPPTSQYLYLQATSANGCVVDDSVFIVVSYINPATVHANAYPPIVTPGSTVALTGSPSGYPMYQWVPSAPVGSPYAQNTQATVDQTTVFTLFVSDGVCTVSDTTEVKVYEIICDGPYVYVPNAFSPNNDGNNDVLYVRGLFVEKMIFRVFDRWGEMVFESTDVNLGWDGIYQGRKLDPDVYDYYLQVTCYGGLENIIKGNVTLMK
jgi:gliding motility-associated-like protein